MSMGRSLRAQYTKHAASYPNSVRWVIGVKENEKNTYQNPYLTLVGCSIEDIGGHSKPDHRSLSSSLLTSHFMAQNVHFRVDHQLGLIIWQQILSYNSTDIIFSPYGVYWRQLPKLCALELLSKKQIQSFRSIREEEMLNLINWIASTAAGSPVNLTDKVYSFTCGVTSRAAFEKKCKDQEEFLSAVNETGKFGIRSRLEKLHHVTDRILENIINDHNNQGKTTTSDVGTSNDEENHEDLVDVLLKVQQDGDIKLTIDSIKAVIWQRNRRFPCRYGGSHDDFLKIDMEYPEEVTTSLKFDLVEIVPPIDGRNRDLQNYIKFVLQKHPSLG
ncbi:hypothetical protein Ddye_025540 [Dipteronia dyeriana]|uniref:Uncharacterized protein n=1 Tax=Dipteronia dyeriana TaxID=168575 RepID=A0AAD9TKE4_9ROSI|nr:hypothetical protein Ddye_025540 [Dipteronia dyeriana]